MIRPVYRFPKFLLFIMLALVGLPSCTPHHRLESLRTALAELQSQRSPVMGLEGTKDFRGVIHVHSYLSHDSEGGPEEIIQGAKEAGLNFIIMTDHDTPQIFTQGMQGWHQGILIIRGMEIIKGCHGAADRCTSLLAIGLAGYFDHRPLTFQQVLDEVHRQGGVAIVAHPRGWRDWTLEGITGIEIYDILDDAMDKKWKFPKYFFDILYSYNEYPDEIFLSIQDRPVWHLKKWDQLTQERKMVGIAGNDAHQNVKVMGRRLDPYSLSFHYVTTHILAPQLDEPSVMSALRAGHAYVAFDLLSDATGFLFVGSGGSHQAVMGDQFLYTPGQILTARLPSAGLIIVIKDGQPFRQCYCHHYSIPVEGPGVYRVEVFLKVQNRWRPWIFSNPIYVR